MSDYLQTCMIAVLTRSLVRVCVCVQITSRTVTALILLCGRSRDSRGWLWPLTLRTRKMRKTTLGRSRSAFCLCFCWSVCLSGENQSMCKDSITVVAMRAPPTLEFAWNHQYHTAILQHTACTVKNMKVSEGILATKYKYNFPVVFRAIWHRKLFFFYWKYRHS